MAVFVDHFALSKYRRCQQVERERAIRPQTGWAAARVYTDTGGCPGEGSDADRSNAGGDGKENGG